VEVLRDPLPLSVLHADHPPRGVLQRRRLSPDDQQLGAQSSTHALQSIREPPDLVAAIAVEGAVEITAGDRGGGGGQAHQRPGHHPRQEERDRATDHQQ